MKSLLLLYFVVFVYIAVFCTKIAEADTESLYEQLSIKSFNVRIIRGQQPKLTFSPSNISCSRSTFSTSSTLVGQAQPQASTQSGGCFVRTCRDAKTQVCCDYRNFYGLDNMLNLGVGLAGGAILANTPIDKEFSDWYQDNMTGADGFSDFCKKFGEGGYMLPIFAVSAVGYNLWQHSNLNKTGQKYPFGEYTVRTLRGYFVGGPTVLVLQSLLGAERPGNDKGSYWRPFHEDHAVSGHAFIGAVPFITAAQMVEKPWLKGVFYFCSVLPAWSRVNDDAHYLSQTVLGWYIAYLSARAVSQTEGTRLPKGLTIFPITEGKFVGIGLHFRR